MDSSKVSPQTSIKVAPVEEEVIVHSLPQQHHQQCPSSTSYNHQLYGKKGDMGFGYWVLLVINYLCIFIGSIASTLLSRFYFIHGGSSRWVSTWVQSAGFPLLLIPIYLIRLFTPSASRSPLPFTTFTPKLFLFSVSIGLMLGLNNFLFSWGISYLSVSTSSLLLSTQLAFNLVLSMLLVKQKLTFSNLNCVILLTVSSVLLALTSSSDIPKGVTQAHYLLGFIAIMCAGFLFALYLPLMEIVYRKVHTYQMVIEIQVIMEMAATVFASIGMACSGGFEEMRLESQVDFDLGGLMYGLTVGFTILSWQLSFMGTAGLVFLTCSLNGGICMTALLPMNVLGGVFAYGDMFWVDKMISTLMCVWGFCSYLFGQIKKMEMEEKKRNK